MDAGWSPIGEIPAAARLAVDEHIRNVEWGVASDARGEMKLVCRANGEILASTMRLLCKPASVDR